MYFMSIFVFYFCMHVKILIFVSMRYIYLLMTMFILGITTQVNAQAPWQIAYGNNGFVFRSEWSSPVPTNVANNRNVLGYIHHTSAIDSTHLWWKCNIFTLSKYRSTRNDGITPANMLFTDTGGIIRSAQWSNLSMSMSQITGLNTALNGKMALASGTSGDLLQYDGSSWSAFTPNYLTSYTETDPVWSGVAANYRTKTQNDLLYEPLFSKNSAFNKNFGSTSGTVAEGNDSRMINGQTAYDWGDHSVVGYLLSSTAASTYQPIGSYATTSALTSGLALKENTISAGSAGQYWDGTKTWVTLNKSAVGLSNVDNTADANKNVLSATKFTTSRTINGQSFDGTGNITIPGSAVTSIPNASLTNASVTVNGNNVALGGSTTITAEPEIVFVSSGNAITMGTAFQPNANSACHIAINASVTGALGLNETVTVAMSSTSGGTYTTVTTDVLLIGLLGLTLDRTVSSIPVPKGYWIKVTRSGSASSATYTKWDY